jgi:cytidylate kinase
MIMARVVSIDGPAGAGKSAAARGLAARLGWRLLDTGAMYRAVALAALRAGVELGDDAALGALANRLRVELPPGAVRLDGADVSSAIRTPEVSQAASRVAACPSVRAVLVGWQRDFAEAQPTVAEGRDQGTVVFPDALRKFYLTASPEERAWRRHAELAAGGTAFEFADVLRGQRERDARDAARAVAPLRPAPDALVVDTTGLSVERVIDLLESATRRAEASGDRDAAPDDVGGLWTAREPGGRLVAIARTEADAERAARNDAGRTDVCLEPPRPGDTRIHSRGPCEHGTRD